MMKTLLLLALMMISSSAQALTGQWHYGATVTNPTTATVFVTTGALPPSGSNLTTPTANYQVGIDLYCSIAETYLLEVLNASSAIQSTIPEPCCATCGANANAKFVPISFPIQDGWSIQIVPQAGFTGFGSAQIYNAVEGINQTH